MSRTTYLIVVISLFVIDTIVYMLLRKWYKKRIEDVSYAQYSAYCKLRKEDFREIDRLQDLLDDRTATNEKLETDIRHERSEKEFAQEQYRKVKKEMSDYVDSIALERTTQISTIWELQGKLAGATQEIEQLKAQLAVNVQALKELSFGGIATGVISKSDYDQLKQEYDLTTKNMVQWMTKCSTLEAERQVYESATSQLEQWTSRCGQLQLHVNNLLAENSTLKLQLTGMASMRSQIMFAVDDTLQQKSASLDELKQKHKEEIAAYENRIGKMEMVYKQHMEEMTKELKQKDADIDRLDREIRTWEAENEKLQTDIVRWRDKCDFFEEKCKELQDEVDKPIKVIRVDENNNPLE